MTDRSPSFIADQVVRRINLVDFVTRFSYKRLRDDEHTFPAESKKLRERGFLSSNDLYDFAAWKSARRPELVLGNEAATVENITQAALRLARDPVLPPSIPIAVLTILKGVGVPTASVILTVWDPERFGIIDVNAWAALFNSTTKLKRTFQPQDFDEYIAILAELRQRTGLTARQIDMALWTWWTKERAKKAAA